MSVVQIPITKLTLKAVEETGLSHRDGARCKNFFALGVLFYMYDRPLEATANWLKKKFAGKDAIIEANTRALNAGYNYGDTT